MIIDNNEIRLLQKALETLADGYSDLPEYALDYDEADLADVLEKVAQRMHDNYPYFHPLYAGQMLKPPHPIARIAYALSLWVNPNNHALDGGRASSAMEKECIVEIGEMFGWKNPLGHLTGGGTVANLEALWVASRLHPGKRIIGSEQAHYTHSRISDVLGIPYTAVPVDSDGRMDIDAIETLLKQGDVGTIVATIGNTGLGAVDPLPDVLALRSNYEFRVHADAAYGGYFGLANSLSERTRRVFEQLERADSIVIDPHKHGLQPYGCGCVLFKDPSVGSLYKHGSPYTYFSSAELHLGEISLECSRAGASAVALWATQQLLPLKTGGEFGSDLDRCLAAAREFHRKVGLGKHFTPLMEPELDIVVYAVRATDKATSSVRARSVFDAAATKNLHLALIELPVSMLRSCECDFEHSSDTITCLRSVLMKPGHDLWVDEIIEILNSCI